MSDYSDSDSPPPMRERRERRERRDSRDSRDRRDSHDRKDRHERESRRRRDSPPPKEDRKKTEKKSEKKTEKKVEKKIPAEEPLPKCKYYNLDISSTLLQGMLDANDINLKAKDAQLRILVKKKKN